MHEEVCNGNVSIDYFTSKCDHYKDKSLCVALPCKVGDVKFVKSKNNNKIMPCEVSGFFIDKNILIDVIFEKATNNSWFEQFSADELSNSKEDAEAKLIEVGK
jgi:hypothetical protein